jgi:glycosyltransferase involved in cell wall biosynthesis
MFSVLIPSYDHAAFLPAAIISALRSRWVEEVLVADDGSADGSCEILERIAGDCRVRRIAAPGPGRLGAALRLDALVAAARCEWVAVLDSDDVFVPGRFEALARICMAGGVSFLAGELLVIDESGAAIGPKRGPLDPEYPFPAEVDVAAKLARHELLDLLANQNFVATTSNMTFTRTLHDRVGGFRELRYAHDWDFALRACLHGLPRWVPQPLSMYRRHPRNTIARDRAVSAGEVRSLFRNLLAEFPDLKARPDFARGLRGNRYLTDAIGDAQPVAVTA